MKTIPFSTPLEESLYKLLFSTTKRFYRRYYSAHPEDTISCITLSLYEILRDHPTPDFSSKDFLSYSSSVLQRNLRLYIQRQIDPPQSQLQRQISYRSKRNEPFFKTVHLLECGLSPSEIQSRLGYCIKRAKTPVGPSHILSPLQFEEIKKLRASGKSIAKIANLYGLTTSQIWRLLASALAAPKVA